MAFAIRIVAGSTAPIYRQIVDQVTRGVASGELSVGESVPSVRQLARELVINPNTVAKAYAELVDSGFLETQAGKGFFVAKRRQVYTKAERLRRIDECIDQLVNQTLALDIAPEEIVQRLQQRFEKNLKPASD
ncbi:MAG: GntR family transcriptional regulator [Planctomycetaceae bacterium]|nr:GntR family transcriptional regulator [Planctomycetaceae bacterium]